MVEQVPLLLAGLAILTCVRAGITKLSLRILRIGGVGWSHAFQIAAIVTVITAALAQIKAVVIPIISLIIVLGVTTEAIKLAVYGWFFKSRGVTDGGAQIGWTGGLKIGVLALALSIVVSTVISVFSPIIILI